jgi:protein-tyrosine phosphatase
MVCLGNICRSPLAEGILSEKARAAGLDWYVDSAGIGGWHAGQGPDRRSVSTALQYGVDIRQQRARQVQVADFERFDRIFAMDGDNHAALLRLARTAEERAKVALILDLTHPGQGREVPDPYYGGLDGFEQVYQMLDAACERLVAEHQQV